MCNCVWLKVYLCVKVCISQCNMGIWGSNLRILVSKIYGTKSQLWQPICAVKWNVLAWHGLNHSCKVWLKYHQQFDLWKQYVQRNGTRRRYAQLGSVLITIMTEKARIVYLPKYGRLNETKIIKIRCNLFSNKLYGNTKT